MGSKNNAMTLLNAAADIRKLYVDSGGTAASIETYLDAYLKDESPEDKAAFIRDLARLFQPRPETFAAPAAPARKSDPSAEKLLNLFSRLFGKSVTKMDLSSEEQLEKLAQSLNMVFNSLNQIIGVIHSTLLGEKPETETIRHIIGSGVEGQGGADSLQSHLDQIQKAFLIAHRAYQEATANKVRQILDEISPEKMAADAEGTLMFGPLKKAEMFESYRDKHALCKKWLESGRMMEEVLRDFEKNCQKLYYQVNTKKS